MTEVNGNIFYDQYIPFKKNAAKKHVLMNTCLLKK